ncbi:hypothetical protein [Kineococcus radiotolerans]|uniref:Uncharacterized protein n=1 Tax=Kineococcus radiotolerans (strain ATCC BAA-149 / DSM 14245 / SRS30216) TaxID=266940 RepID=A6W8N4_KINRD|nr:hypothetical protein [Kineococcus radiotolerans]ABS03173.1 hypothetical protein Krad_1687 [Kineococcus radiotolerans SRS30216 = ATCC BAA-149]
MNDGSARSRLIDVIAQVHADDEGVTQPVFVDHADHLFADKVLAALASAGYDVVPRVEAWDWGVRFLDVPGIDQQFPSEEAARDRCRHPHARPVLLRRRRAGQWEVAL